MLWSEVRFKHYGFHGAGLRRSVVLNPVTLLAESTGSEAATTSDQEEESSEESSVEEESHRPVGEDVYLFAIDLYLHVYIAAFQRLSTVSLQQSLVALGAAKEHALSSHTIHCLIRLAATDRRFANDCEQCLRAIRIAGGNHKLKSSSVDVSLPQEVTVRLEEALREFGDKHPDNGRGTASQASLEVVMEDLDYRRLLHGDTLQKMEETARERRVVRLNRFVSNTN